MASLINDENSIKLRIKLLNNHTYMSKGKSDYENYVPFDFELNVDVENVSYSFPGHPTFSLYEAKKLLSGIEKVISEKNNGKEIRPYNFHSSEAYFDMSVYDTKEEGELYVDLWINMGSMTNGNITDYQKGYRFVVLTNVFEKFHADLEEELGNFLSQTFSK